MSAITLAIKTKTCTACDQEKPHDAFAKNASNADGLQRHCKDCMRDMKAKAKARGETEARGETFAMLPIDQVVESLTNPRSTFDPVKLQELADSVKASGVHQPVLVRVLPANRLDETARRDSSTPRPGWEIVAGARRYRASRMAGKTTIPAMVKQLTDAEVLEIQIVENLQRDDLSELEEAEGYQQLVERTGTQKEEIGAKIGRSRSYVYQRLKLLDLDTAGREALRAGRLDASKALHIARIPGSKLQIMALGQATGDANYGRAMTVKELQTWIQTNVMLSLKRTKFDIKDATLRPEAGACPTCPKRTGADPDLFSDVDSPDLCIDPTCYRAKEKAHDDRRFEEAQREGKKVITAEKAEKMQQPFSSTQWLKGYYELDAYPDYTLGLSGNTLRKSLGKHCPAPVLVKHPETGAVHEVLPVDLVKKTVETHGLSYDAKRLAKQGAKPKETAKPPIQQRREYKERWQRRVLETADAKLRTMSTLPPELLRAWLIHQLEDHNQGAFGPALDLGDEFDEAEAEKRVLAMPEADLPPLMLRFWLWSLESNYEAWDKENERRQGPRTPLFELIHMAEVDLNEARATVQREMESEDRAAALDAEKAEEKEKSTRPPAAGADKARGKPKGKKGVAQATAAPKVTAVEAQMGIAAALQAAEGEHIQAPDGAGLNECAALASPGQAADAAELQAPAASTAGDVVPSLGVGDQVMVIDASIADCVGCNGTVTALLASGLVRVAFPGLTSELACKPSALQLITSAASGWPFPTLRPSSSEAPLKIGQLARVKADSKGPGGKLLKSIGQVGRVVGLGEDGRVHLKQGERKHELLVALPEHVEPYTADPLIGSKVRIMAVGISGTRDRFLWRVGSVKAPRTDGWLVEFPGRIPAPNDEAIFGTEELEVLL